jgi:hypothetical protein
MSELLGSYPERRQTASAPTAAVLCRHLKDVQEGLAEL